MNHEVEEHRCSNPQDPVDAGSPHGGEFERFEKFESCSQGSRPREAKGCQSEHEGGRARASLPSDATNGSNPSEGGNTSDPNQPSEGGVENGDEVAF